MIRGHVQVWIDKLDLTFEQAVLASMALKLAESFDKDGNTSTAAELRKTILEISRQAKGSEVPHDPLAELLTR